MRSSLENPVPVSGPFDRTGRFVGNEHIAGLPNLISCLVLDVRLAVVCSGAICRPNCEGRRGKFRYPEQPRRYQDVPWPI